MMSMSIRGYFLQVIHTITSLFVVLMPNFYILN
jgi:hypothetical protein